MRAVAFYPVGAFTVPSPTLALWRCSLCPLAFRYAPPPPRLEILPARVPRPPHHAMNFKHNETCAESDGRTQQMRTQQQRRAQDGCAAARS